MQSKHDENVSGLRISEAAALLGVHPDTLRRWSDEGKVPVSRTPGGERRYNRADLVAVYSIARP